MYTFWFFVEMLGFSKILGFSLKLVVASRGGVVFQKVMKVWYETLFWGYLVMGWY